MNAIKNETRLCYCDICDKTIKIKCKSKHLISKMDKHKKEFGIVVKKYEFTRPDMDEVNSKLNNTIEDCRNKYFHSFECRCVFDIKFTNMQNNKMLFCQLHSDIWKIFSNLWFKKFKKPEIMVLFLIKK